jgi:ATP-dependent DNA ligase
MGSPFEPQMLSAPKGYTNPEPTMPSPAEWIMEPKLDGWRFVFHHTADGDVVQYGRRGRMSWNVPSHIIDAISQLPPDTIVDTELVVDGVDTQSTDVHMALAGNQPERLTAYVFDMMRLAGHDMRSLAWTDRRHVLETALEDGEHCLQPIPVYEPDLDLFKQWLSLGVEGAALKRKASRYCSGARNRDWIKLKPQHTIDVQITGFFEGAGKRLGHANTITFMHEGRECVATVADFPLSIEMWNHQEAYLGRWVEVAYHVGRANGADYLRHPICTRMRPDLEATAA